MTTLRVDYVKPSWYGKPAWEYARCDDEQIAQMADVTRKIDQENRERYQEAVQAREARRAAALRRGDEREALSIARQTIPQPESYFQRWLKYKTKIDQAREARRKLDRANELAAIRRQKARDAAQAKRERETQARKEAAERLAAERAEHGRKVREGLHKRYVERRNLNQAALRDFDDLCLLDGVDPALMWAWVVSVDEAFEWWREELEESGAK